MLYGHGEREKSPSQVWKTFCLSLASPPTSFFPDNYKITAPLMEASFLFQPYPTAAELSRLLEGLSRKVMNPFYYEGLGAKGIWTWLVKDGGRIKSQGLGCYLSSLSPGDMGCTLSALHFSCYKPWLRTPVSNWFNKITWRCNLHQCCQQTGCWRWLFCFVFPTHVPSDKGGFRSRSDHFASLSKGLYLKSKWLVLTLAFAFYFPRSPRSVARTYVRKTIVLWVHKHQLLGRVITIPRAQASQTC